MRELHIRRGAKVRVVYCPSRSERERSLALLPLLAAAERKAAHLAGTAAVAHGFIAARSPVTGALPHRGKAVTVSCDLAGWFDSVRPEQIAAGLVSAGHAPEEAEEMARSACYRGAPRQGLPSSPAACNLAAVPMDTRILAALPPGAVYTRYADDLTVSLPVDDPRTVDTVLQLLSSAAAAMGWTVATHKTRVQRARAGRRVICGVSVAEDLRAPRETRRRLRAAKRNAELFTDYQRKAAGLGEWCAMRLPRAVRPSRQLGLGAIEAPAPTVQANPPAAVHVGTRRLYIPKE